MAAEIFSKNQMLDETRCDENSKPPPYPLTRTDWLWLAALLLVALFLRLYRLAELPRGFFVEYVETAASAIRTLITGEPYFFYTFNAPEWQYMLFVKSHHLYMSDAFALVFALFGTSMLAYRAFVTFLGLGFIVVLYVYLRREFGPAPARIAAALATISFWCLALSREGWAILIYFAMVYAALIIIWSQALRTAKWLWYLAGILLLSVSLYGYRVVFVFPLLIAAIIAFFAVTQGKNFWLRHWLRLTICALIFIILISPFVHFALTTNYPEVIGAQAVWDREPSIKGKNTPEKVWKKSLVLFGDEALYVRVGRGWRKGVVPVPGGQHGWLFNPITSTFALLGLAVCLRRLKKFRYFTLLLALALAPIPAMLSHPVTRRLVLLTVPILSLAGIGAAILLKSAQNAMPLPLKRLPALILAISLFIALTLNLSGFRHVISAPGYTEMLPIAQWNAKLIDRNYVYVVIQKHKDKEYLLFCTFAKTGRKFNKYWQHLPFSLVDKNSTLLPAQGRPAIFLLHWSPKLDDLPAQLAFWEKVKQKYPELTIRVLPLYHENRNYLETRLLALNVPDEAIPQMPPLLERFYRYPLSP
jgi:hypothetical protein